MKFPNKKLFVTKRSLALDLEIHGLTSLFQWAITSFINLIPVNRLKFANFSQTEAATGGVL